MSDYNGCYVKIEGDPTYWAVDGGGRSKVGSPAAMMAIGLRPVVTVSQAELDAIPLFGQRKRTRRPRPKPVPEEKEEAPEEKDKDEE